MGDFLLMTTGVLAALFTVSSFAFQIAKTWRSRDASGVSLKMYLFTVSAFLLWIVYGVGGSAWPLVAANGVSLLLSGAALWLKWRFTIRREQPRVVSVRRANPDAGAATCATAGTLFRTTANRHRRR